MTSNIEDVYVFPTTYPQKQIWFINQLNQDSPAYNIPFAYDIEGDLNTPAMQRAINEIIRRHETFRTIFMDSNDGPVQVIHPELVIEVPVIDYSQSKNADTEIKEYIDSESIRIFDLSTGPLIRASIIKRGESSYILVLNFHHIILDHISIVQFAEELSLIYQAYLNKESSPLVEPELQYGDYAVWQEEYQSYDHLLPKLDFWSEQLKGKSEYLDVPLDHQRPSRQTMVGKEYNLWFPLSLSKKLKELSREKSVSMYITLMAGYSILLGIYSKQTDVSVGTPFANRSHQPELEKIMGCFINTLPIVTDLSGNPSFNDVLKRVRKMVFSASANQEIPLKTILEKLQPKRDASYNPLFQVGFTYQEPPMEIELAGCSVKSQRLHNQSAKFDILAWLWESDDGIRGLVEYNTDIFEYSTLENFSIHLQTLLEDAVDNPDEPISQLNILSDAERQLVLHDWNQTQKTYSNISTVHGLFESQVDDNRQKVAVICGDGQYTYGELNEKSNQLAHYLIDKGIKPGQLVGLCLDRSVNMFVVLLGILKTGAGYVPLDPEYPEDRLNYMVSHSGLQVLVTQSGHIDQFSGVEYLLDFYSLDDELKSLSTDSPNVTYSETNTAYVIYTSGSTGKPKGVQVPHSAVVNLLNSIAEEPGLNKDDRLLGVSTLSFDIATIDIFLPLTVGAQSIITEKDDAIDGDRLLELMDKHNITFMQATPITWRLLIAAGWEGNDDITVISTGEALPQDLAIQLSKLTKNLWNLYGPTETTVWSSLYRVTDAEAPILIGRPIANTQLYILDEHLKPVPIGVHGELYIGGAGVTKGYLGRDDLTKSSFINSPFSSSGKRLYKTGDAVKFRESGEIEYYQRIDNQVKVRGFRIELGEIESVIDKQEGIEQAVVVVREMAENDPRLVAYIVASEDTDINPASIRSMVRDDLPAYMIPQHVVKLNEFPLTPNGKVNRKALVELESVLTDSGLDRADLSSQFVAPSTDLMKMKKILQKSGFRL